MKKEKFQWWGYLHTSGTISVKRYFEPRDISEAQESSFVKFTYGPFEAKSRDEAEKILEKIFLI